MKSIIIVYVIISQINLSFGQESAIALNKGDAAPFSGILLSRETALEARNAAIDRDRYKLLNESLQKSIDLQSKNIDIQEQRIELYRKDTDNLSKQLYDARNVNNWERIGWFVLGVAATGFAGYVITRVK